MEKARGLEQELYKMIKKFGPGSAFYLNGEYIADADELEMKLNS